MVTFIGKPILPKLLTRFGSQQGDDSKMILSSSVSPIIDVAQLTVSITGQETSGTATTRNDTYTVPTGKKWILRNLVVSRANAGTCDITLIKSDGITDYIIYSTGATTVTNLNLNNLYFVMPSGWAVNIALGNGTSGTIGSTIVYDEYDEYG